MGKIYKGDVGVRIRVDTGIDLSNSTMCKLYVLTPTGETQWTDVVVTTGRPEYCETQGLSVIEYITKENDLSVDGQYTVISYVEFGQNSRHYGEPARFVVYQKFKP